MNPQVAAFIEVVKALGIRMGLVFLLIVLWNPEPPGTYPRSAMIAFRYLACLAGATVSYWWKPRAMRNRAKRLIVCFVATIGFFVLYRYAITPSQPAYELIFRDMAYASYILTSSFYGFCSKKISVASQG